MKILDPEIKLASSGVQSQRTFQIAQSQKMFKLLSDSLYSDKITAVIRELSTNALDSQVVAGTLNKKFVVHLPSTFAPHFSVLDFGTGLTVEQMEGMYRTYGASDKTHSDELVGAMGLGSKSPFAYTKSFTSTSYKDGMQHNFICAINEDGFPTINHMGSVPTSEPNGLEVKFNVKPAHFNEFCNKAGEVYKFFGKHKPEVKGNAAYKCRELTYKVTGNGWAIPQDYASESYAIMGNIAYPIDSAHFSVDGTASSMWSSNKTIYTEMLGLGLHITFAIGEVEMDISREGLQYHKRTIEAIKRRIDEIVAELKVKLESEFKGCKTLWDARCLYHKISSESIYTAIKAQSIVTPTWNGKDIKDVIDIKDFPPVLFTRHYNKIKRAKNPARSIYASDDYVFVENDVVNGAYSGTMRYLEANTAVQAAYLITFKDSADRQKFIDLLGIDEKLLIKASQFPKVVRQKGQGTTRPNESVNLFDISGSQQINDGRYSRRYWKVANVDIANDTGYYVRIDAFEVEDMNMQTTAFVRLLNTLKGLGVKIPAIYGVKTASIDKFQKSANWTHIKEYLKEQIAQYIAKHNVEQHLANIDALRSISSSNNQFDACIKNIGLFKHQNGDYVKWLRKIEGLRKSQKLADVHSQIMSVAGELDIAFGGKIAQDLSKEEEAIEKKYFLMDEFRYLYHNSEGCKRFIRFVNLVDEAESCGVKV